MPIFIIGIRRSGSNLLRLMLNQLPEIAAPHPPHILQHMTPLIPRYGDLNDPEVFSLLVDDVCRLVELNPVSWEGVVLDRRDIMARCRKPSLVAVFGAVYDVAAEARCAKTWCCKSLENIYSVNEIEDYFTDAKYIYLYRDGRDVAASFRKARVVVGEKHFYHIAREWNKIQQLALDWRHKIPRKRFFNLSYEQLTESTEEAARSLCSFLKVSYKDSMLEFHKSMEAKKTASSSSLWANVASPIITKNNRKFLKEASETDIRIFESVAGEAMDALGYKRVLVKKGQELHFSEDDIGGFDRENKKLKEETHKQIELKDLGRRNRQENLLKEIMARQTTAELSATSTPLTYAVKGIASTS
ncbi:MAG TPA: sulfotransferase [Acidiferrobacterales bacterium]|nr:sulfotransferase [Acidiferrobacterales bacterium]